MKIKQKLRDLCEKNIYQSLISVERTRRQLYKLKRRKSYLQKLLINFTRYFLIDALESSRFSG